MRLNFLFAVKLHNITKEKEIEDKAEIFQRHRCVKEVEIVVCKVGTHLVLR